MTVVFNCAIEITLLTYLRDVVQVQFEGATGTVAFDSYGRRRNYRLDVLEHRLDNEIFKVP